MPNRKWRKQLSLWPDLALLGCCLVSLHFLWGILRQNQVQAWDKTLWIGSMIQHPGCLWSGSELTQTSLNDFYMTVDLTYTRAGWSWMRLWDSKFQLSCVNLASISKSIKFVFRASERGGVIVKATALRPRGVVQHRRVRLEPHGLLARHGRHRPQGLPLELWRWWW